MLNTFWFSVGACGDSPPLFLALCLPCCCTDFKGSQFYRAVIFYSPWITPTVAVCVVWSWVFGPSRV
ncbi:hypothetical protein OK016_29895 [Vibrio chagasii]|nr:hypothetical protein [Vibrio chagasii]